jgi:outer membrane murein-binding lipoprotein Lpp
MKIKTFASVLALSSFLASGNISWATDAYDYHHPDNKAAAFKIASSKAQSQQAQWWDEFLKSKQEIHKYVDNIASLNPEAAMWFLFTGGKNGFSHKGATDEQKESICSTIKKVAESFYNRKDTLKGLDTLTEFSSHYDAGHIHVKMLFDKIQKLTKEVDIFKNDNKTLESRIQKTNLIAEAAKEDARRANAKSENIQSLLDQERKERILDQKNVLKQIAAAEDRQSQKLEAVYRKLTKETSDSKNYFILALKDSKKEIAALLETSNNRFDALIEAERKERGELAKTLKAEADERERNYKLELKEEAATREQKAKEELKKYLLDLAEKDKTILQKEKELIEKEMGFLKKQYDWEVKKGEGLESKNQELLKAIDTLKDESKAKDSLIETQKSTIQFLRDQVSQFETEVIHRNR